jgi:hypothetical protein
MHSRLIHPSSWNKNSAKLNFRFIEFCELRLLGILRSWLPEIATRHTKIAHMGDAPSTWCLLCWEHNNLSRGFEARSKHGRLRNG